MNDSGAVGPVAVFFSFMAFLLVWFVWLGGWLVDVGEMVVASGEVDGVLLFVCSNLNLVVMFAAVLGMLVYFTTMGVSQ